MCIRDSYIYGYVQDLDTGMWQYIILDFATGETVFTMDVSNKYGYNNMAIGMSVSYTHLDVYKRQVQVNEILSDARLH